MPDDRGRVNASLEYALVRLMITIPDQSTRQTSSFSTQAPNRTLKVPRKNVFLAIGNKGRTRCQVKLEKFRAETFISSRNDLEQPENRLPMDLSRRDNETVTTRDESESIDKR